MAVWSLSIIIEGLFLSLDFIVARKTVIKESTQCFKVKVNEEMIPCSVKCSTDFLYVTYTPKAAVLSFMYRFRKFKQFTCYLKNNYV